MNAIRFVRSIPPVVVILVIALPLSSQTRPEWHWPEHPENLKVLPKEIRPEELRDTMVGFAGSLGVRCHFCHVGKEGQPFAEWDFASDEKTQKQVARQMMSMVKAINGTYLKDVHAASKNPIEVNCSTCHRGRPTPETLEHLLSRTVASDGTAAGLARYRELREQFYGSASYDFGERTLIRLASELQSQKKLDEAVAFLELNAEMYPKSAATYIGIGSIREAMGETAAAIAAYEKALSIEPDAKRAAQALERLRPKQQ